MQYGLPIQILTCLMINKYDIDIKDMVTDSC